MKSTPCGYCEAPIPHGVQCWLTHPEPKVTKICCNACHEERYP